ncbi:MerR family DNA-binding transcriptional regulator [Barrientosiimonas humi]|uniref:MerR family DNA-binding transcriptional regulator n=1 Tax=Barrientosiimonas humi TaxID=999931 RepID=UPI00370D2BB0
MSIAAVIGTEPELTVSDVAAESGVASSAVRFYERYGVIRAQRTAGNQRRFASDASCRIKVAKLAQRVGLTVREIAETFDTLPPEPQPEDWSRIAGQLVTEAEQRVEALKRATAAMSGGGHLCELDEALATMR